MTDKVIDFSHHDIRREILKLRDYDWVHCHITDKAITIGGKTYSLDTDLSYSCDKDVPELYFGETEQDRETTLELTVIEKLLLSPKYSLY